MDQPRLSVVMPAKNEAENVQKVIQAIRQHVPEAEILVVDDGSTDLKGSLAKPAGARVISHRYSMGNGAAVKTGARSATGDVLVFMADALCAFYIPETLLLAVGILNTAGRYDISKGLLTDARDREPPRHPIRAIQ